VTPSPDFETRLRAIAESLLDRRLTPSDGIDPAECQAAQARLQVPLPEALRVLHECVGNVPAFMTSFQRFAKLDELRIEDSRLVFAEENQGVCCWGVRPDDAAQVVWQQNDGKTNAWHAESLDLPSFVLLLLYYQLAQGGYAHAASLDTTDPDEAPATRALFDALGTGTGSGSGWQRVVDHNALVIHADGPRLVWYFGDASGPSADDGTVFASMLEAADLEPFVQRFNFQRL
jgi:hypothetical protein